MSCVGRIFAGHIVRRKNGTHLVIHYKMSYVIKNCPTLNNLLRDKMSYIAQSDFVNTARVDSCGEICACVVQLGNQTMLSEDCWWAGVIESWIAPDVSLSTKKSIKSHHIIRHKSQESKMAANFQTGSPKTKETEKHYDATQLTYNY